jgi:transposase-like protein
MPVKKKLPKLTGDTFRVRKTKTETGENELVFTYADILRSHRYSDDEKKKIIDIVCYAYEQGVSIESICKELGVSAMTVYRWVSPNSVNAFKYGVERYKYAKEVFNFAINENDVFKARARLAAKLDERKVVNTTLYYENKDGEMTLKGKTETERVIEPDITAIQLILKNLDTDFKKVKGTETVDLYEELQYMTAEELEIELAKEKERGATLSESNYYN